MNIRARLITADGCVQEIDSIPETRNELFTSLIEPVSLKFEDTVDDRSFIRKRRYRLKDVETLAIYEEVL